MATKGLLLQAFTGHLAARSISSPSASTACATVASPNTGRFADLAGLQTELSR